MAMGKSEASVKSQSKSKKKDKDVLPTKVIGYSMHLLSLRTRF